MSSLICSASSYLLRALFHVRAGEFLHVVLVERGLHRTDLAQELLRFGQMFGAEDGGVLGGLIGAVRKNVPPAKDDVFQRRQRHEVLDRRSAPFGPLSEADGSHLRQGADGQRFLSPDQIHAGHERCGDRTHADGEDSQFSLRQGNARGLAHSHFSCRFQCVRNSEAACGFASPSTIATVPDVRKPRIMRESREDLQRGTSLGGGLFRRLAQHSEIQSRITGSCAICRSAPRSCRGMLLAVRRRAGLRPERPRASSPGAAC